MRVKNFAVESVSFVFLLLLLVTEVSILAICLYKIFGMTREWAVFSSYLVFFVVSVLIANETSLKEAGALKYLHKLARGRKDLGITKILVIYPLYWNFLIPIPKITRD